MSKYKKQSHVAYKCGYHIIVWVSKHRFCILTGEVSVGINWDIRLYSEWLGLDVIKYPGGSCAYYSEYTAEDIWERLKGRRRLKY